MQLDKIYLDAFKSYSDAIIRIVFQPSFTRIKLIGLCLQVFVMIWICRHLFSSN